MSLEVELTPWINHKSGLPVDKAVDYVERAREYVINDDGEQMFALIFEIWETAKEG